MLTISCFLFCFCFGMCSKRQLMILNPSQCLVKLDVWFICNCTWQRILRNNSEAFLQHLHGLHLICVESCWLQQALILWNHMTSCNLGDHSFCMAPLLQILVAMTPSTNTKRTPLYDLPCSLQRQCGKELQMALQSILASNNMCQSPVSMLKHNNYFTRSGSQINMYNLD